MSETNNERFDEALPEDERPLDGGPDEPMLEGTDGVDVTVVGINGEWLPDALDLGDSIKLEVYATVIAVGEKLRGGDKAKPVKRFVKLDVNGVEIIG